MCPGHVFEAEGNTVMYHVYQSLLGLHINCVALILTVFRKYDSLCLHSSIIFDDNFCDSPDSYSSGPSFAFQSLMLPLKKIDDEAVYDF